MTSYREYKTLFDAILRGPAACGVGGVADADAVGAAVACVRGVENNPRNKKRNRTANALSAKISTVSVPAF